MERIFAIIAIGLGGLSAVLGLAFAWHGHLNIPPDIWFSYLITLLTLFMTYVYWAMEKNREALKKIADTPFHGVTIFDDSASLLDSITSLTVGARTVCTINLSDTPEVFSHLAQYFEKVHDYVRTGSPLVSFRRIAGLQDASKALWLLEVSDKLVGSSRLSVAFADMRTVETINLCLHIVSREEGCFSYIFPSIAVGGSMPAILIKNDMVAKALTEYFDSLWAKLPHLHEGAKVSLKSFDVLEAWFPELKSNAKYNVLRGKLYGRGH